MGRKRRAKIGEKGIRRRKQSGRGGGGGGQRGKTKGVQGQERGNEIVEENEDEDYREHERG